MTVAPEHVLHRLTDLRARGHGLGEHGVRVGDLEAQDDGGSADRRWPEHAHLGKLDGDVRHAVANTDMSRPSGVGIRLISSAPRASR